MRPPQQLSFYNKIWTAWFSQSVGRKVLHAALTVGILNGLVKVIVLVKELAVAWRFGIGDNLDVFFTAILVPGIVVTVVAGSMYTAFLPTYVQVAERDGSNAAERLLCNATLWSGAVLSILALLLALLAHSFLPFLATGFSPAKLDMTVQLFYLFVPWIVISGLQMLWGATLNSAEHFALTSISPIVTPVLILAAIAFDAALTPAGIAAATTIGALIEATIIYVALYKRGVRILPQWHGFDPATRQVAKQLAPMVAGAAIMSSNLLVDQFFVATLPAGSVSTLAYGNRLTYFLIGFVTTALSTAILPYFAKLAVHEDWAGLRRLLLRFVGASFAIFVPLTALLFLLSEPIVTIMYQRGAFSAQDTAMVSQVQRLFALQIPFYIGAILCVRFVAAIRRNVVLMIGAIINLVINIVFDYVLMQIMGVAGIAFATVFMYTVSFGFLFTFSVWYLRRQPKRATLQEQVPSSA